MGGVRPKAKRKREVGRKREKTEIINARIHFSNFSKISDNGTN